MDLGVEQGSTMQYAAKRRFSAGLRNGGVCDGSVGCETVASTRMDDGATAPSSLRCDSRASPAPQRNEDSTPTAVVAAPTPAPAVVRRFEYSILDDIFD